MFFYLSKFLWFFIVPLNFIAGLLLAYLLLSYFKKCKKAQQILLLLSISLFLTGGLLPVGNNLLYYLESRYPIIQSHDLPDKIDGVIVLGGFIDPVKSIQFGQVHVNDNAERLTEMMVLMHRYPKAKIVFTGGSGSIKNPNQKEADSLAHLLQLIGIENDVIYENKSRNTYENAVLSKAMLKPKLGDKWILVTSAFHMPRSVAIFKKQEWEVVPYPAGVISSGKLEFIPSFDVLGNFHKLSVAMREIIGIIAYKLTNKI